ncbi:choice-of-anchor I family protein [Nocardiopsis lambiniae]|uniref:Choice-of-anchor I family protein n=1 Tax=Nocardiopsis lambiniae TaxID=3075539 RepID=A0ABU2MAW3_9ACTN|nr:choice-of-anchor I family protein [Nocardiopsis sp. DSM 44743]MDT0329805.1 choice-of-anchor I family protein [Nocardiopsis sp. DSM 44743]
MRKTTAVATALTVALTGAAAHADERSDGTALSPLGTYATGAFDRSAAEIVAHDPRHQRLYVVNALAATVEVVDISDPTAPTKLFDLAAPGVPAADGSVVEEGVVANSVAIHGDTVAVAVEAADGTDPGWVVFYDTRGNALNAVRVGALPDMATFTPDGRLLLVANEGEPNDDFTVDPEGSISVIKVNRRPASVTQRDVRTADFRAWDEGRELPEGVRVFGPDLSTGEPGTPGRVARNLEPEYIVADTAHSAYAVLQEANAFAVIDLRTAEVTEIVPFGLKDHMEPGNGLDASDRDGAIRIENLPVYGMYQPDGFDSYRHEGRTLLVTANEGDVREWGDYAEGVRVKNLELCEDSPRLRPYLDANGLTLADLQRDENLGRLTVSAAEGLTEDGCHDELHAFGGRSFSIFTTDGEVVFDSGSDFERITAEANPDFFNSNHTENTFETRSDDKGPEPEGVTLGVIDGRTYAFVGLERVGGVMVYDITDPEGAAFVDYVNNRDFSATPGTPEAGDLGAEGLTFIAAEDSPLPGVPLLAVANEVSGTTTLFRVDLP